MNPKETREFVVSDIKGTINFLESQIQRLNVRLSELAKQYGEETAHINTEIQKIREKVETYQKALTWLEEL